MPASGPGPASFYLGWEASLVNLSQILGFLDAPLHPSMTFLSVGKFFLGTSLLLPVPHWRDTLMATETQALSTPGEAEEGRVGHPIHRFQSGLGGGSLLPHLSCSVPLSRRCWVWLGKGKSVPTPIVTAGNEDTLVHLPPDVTSSSVLLLLFLSFRVPLGAEF